MVGLLRLVRLRRRPRHRVQRDPRGGRPDRRVAALQVPSPRPRRDTPRRPGHHPRRDEAGRRPGLLRPCATTSVCRRRRHGPPPRGTRVPLDGGRPAVPLAAPQPRGLDVSIEERERGRRRGRPPGAAVAGRARGGDRRVLRGPPLLPAPGGEAADRRPAQGPDRRVADRLHGRSRLRAVDPGGARGGGLGAP